MKITSLHFQTHLAFNSYPTLSYRPFSPRIYNLILIHTNKIWSELKKTYNSNRMTFLFQCTCGSHTILEVSAASESYLVLHDLLHGDLLHHHICCHRCGSHIAIFHVVLQEIKYLPSQTWFYMSSWSVQDSKYKKRSSLIFSSQWFIRHSLEPKIWKICSYLQLQNALYVWEVKTGALEVI